MCAITSYRPGDGTREHPPKLLVTTYVATMGNTQAFGKLVRLEAERRGLRRAETVLVMGDAGNWIDPLNERERLGDHRIVGWPIGSGVAKSAVKLFNKRVKGTEQFWNVPQVASILSLRALWLSQDGRWSRLEQPTRLCQGRIKCHAPR